MIEVNKLEKYELENINLKIKKQICYKTIKLLSDKNLINEYLSCKSVKLKVNRLKNILSNNNISIEKIEKITHNYIFDLVPAGTKGVIKGNKFNKIVKDYILNLKLDLNIYEIKFETKCYNVNINEIPDWYIKNKINSKIIIGMNQLDLWSGGHQINRGYKYIIESKLNSNNIKLLCIVCNDLILKSKKTKIFNLIKFGFNKNTLCYLNNLSNIIKSFLN